jgi:hypothetical protein
MDATQMLIGLGVLPVAELECAAGVQHQAEQAWGADRQRHAFGLGGEFRHSGPVAAERRDLSPRDLGCDLRLGTREFGGKPPGLLGRGYGYGEVAYLYRRPGVDRQHLYEQAQASLLAQPPYGRG